MTIFLQTIDKAWQGSSRIASYADSLAAGSAPGYNWLTTILVLIVLLYCIYFYHQIVLAASLSLNTFFGSSSKLYGICENQTSLASVNTTSIICMPVAAMMIHALSGTSLDLVYVFAAVAAYLVVRILLFKFTAWYKGGGAVFEIIRNSGKVTLVVATILSFPALLIPMLSGPDTAGFARIYFMAVFALCFAMYCVRACGYLLEAGFSIFFCFLYLCALEFLPAGLLISAIISL